MAIDLALAVVWLLASGAHSLAADDFWKTAASGTWQTGSNWVDNTAPGGDDSASFNLLAAYTVTFDGTPPAIQALNVLNSVVTFESIGFFAGQISTLRVNSVSGSQDVAIESGAILTLGTSPRST